MYHFYTHPTYSQAQVVVIPFDSIKKIDFALCNQPTETPDAYYKRQAVKPDIITNGGFFALSTGTTCFSYFDEGKCIATSEHYGVGVVGDKELRFTSTASGCRDFIGAYPPFVVDGKAYKIDYAQELNYNARRTCIGWDNDYYYIVVVDKPGLAYKALQDIFLGLGAKYAINLDGGGSTRLLINGNRKTSECYARPVDNVMCVYLNHDEDASIKPAPATIYRVQVGAFGIKSNADKLLVELRAAGFNDAYVKKVGLLYKVQVGAFGVKLNAERLKDRLTSMGYKPFITTA